MRTTRTWLFVLACASLGAGCGSDGEPEGDPLPAKARTILEASSEAMAAVTSVHFDLERSGAAVYIDQFQSLAVDRTKGRFSAPGGADAVLSVTVDGSLKTKLGAVALGGDVFMSWQWQFWLNVPLAVIGVAVIGVAVTWRERPGTGRKGGRKPLPTCSPGPRGSVPGRVRSGSEPILAWSGVPIARGLCPGLHFELLTPYDREVIRNWGRGLNGTENTDGLRWSGRAGVVRDVLEPLGALVRARRDREHSCVGLSRIDGPHGSYGRWA